MTRLSAVVIVLVTGVIARADLATPYDIATGYSTTTNPGGVWSYGTKSSFVLGSSSIALYSFVQNNYAGSVNLWDNSASGAVTPFASKNLGLSPASDGASQWPANTVVSHAAASLASVIRFTVPQTSYYEIDASFLNRSLSLAGTRVFVYANGSELFQATLGNFNAPAQVMPTKFVSLAAGGWVDFMVAPRADGTPNSTSTAITATIVQAVPEAGTVILFSTITCAVVAQHLWRRFRAAAPVTV